MGWTRVRDKNTGHHLSVPRVDPKNHEVLKQDALDRNGLPLPPKYKEPKGGAAETPATDEKGGASK